MTARDPHWYVYALAARGLPAALRLPGHSLDVLTIAGVDVIVERRPERPHPTADVLRDQHRIVARLAERSDAILPARFGTWVDETALRKVITGHTGTITRALAAVRGRQQMTVRVFGAPDVIAPAAGRPASGTAFLESRRARVHAVPADVATIRTVLGGLVADERVEAGGPGLRLTVFHLVPAALVGTYREKASELVSGLAPHDVRISGPWPPFAFAPDLF